MLRRQTAPVLLLLLVLTGCGWVEDATAFTVCSEQQRFELDMGALTFTEVSAEQQIPFVPCQLTAECQQVLVACSGPRYSCSVDCMQADGTTVAQGDALELCPAAVTLDYEEMVDIDLSERMSPSQARLLGRARMTRLEVGIDHNSLNLSTPRLDVRVGPVEAHSGSATGVEQLATIEPVAPGETFDARETPTTAGGRTRLAELVQDVRQPFRLFVRGQLKLQSGQPIPSGKLTATVAPCFRMDL